MSFDSAPLPSLPSVVSLSTETKFQLIQEITEKISRSLDIDEVLGLIVDTVRSFVPYDAAAIYILESTDGDKRIRNQMYRDYDESYAHMLKLKFGEGIVGWVIQNGRGIIIPDVRKDARYVEADPHTQSELVAPIIANGRVIGAFNLENHRLNAYTETHLEVLSFFAAHAAISIEKAFLHHERLEKRRLESELSVARQVQLSLLPDKDPQIPGFDVSGINVPSKSVGGDYFDFIPFPNRQLGICIADVSGKGVPSALIMAGFRASLRAQVRNDFAIRGIFRKVNYLLWESVTGANYVTAIYGVLDPYTRRFSYADAGHNPMILLRPDDTTCELSCGNTVLGLFEERDYKECNRRLKPGEIVVMYTDGVTEAARDEVEFGVSGLVNVIRTLRHLPARDIAAGIYEAAREYSGQAVLDDDLTVVVIKVLDDAARDEKNVE